MNVIATPRVTVLMPVYNGEKYLREAIESILTQTFTDFEFLIINDGSTDTSADIIKSFNDVRIKLVDNKKNLGLIATLNKGLDLACGEYIARMDCDDISLPERLKKQVLFMDNNQNVGVCGTWFQWIGESVKKTLCFETNNESIKCGLLFNSRIGHPTVMLKKKDFIKNNLYYYDTAKHVEDYELWTRACQFTDVANIGEVLLLYRIHPQQVSQVMSVEQKESLKRVRLTQIRKLGIEPTNKEIEIHQNLSHYSENNNSFSPKEVDEWAIKLLKANACKKIYHEEELIRVLSGRWVALYVNMIRKRNISMEMLKYPSYLKGTKWGKGLIIKELFSRLSKEMLRFKQVNNHCNLP